MNATRHPGGRLGRIVLLVLLLAAQGLVLAHEIDHIGFPGSGDCVTCTLHAGSDAIGSAAEPCLYPANSPSPEPQVQEQILATRRNYQTAARAPPCHL